MTELGGKKTTKSLAVAGLVIAFLGFAACVVGMVAVILLMDYPGDAESRLITLVCSVPGGLFSLTGLTFSIIAFLAARRHPIEPGARTATIGIALSALGTCLAAATAVLFFGFITHMPIH